MSFAVMPSVFNAAPDGLAVSSFTAVSVPPPLSTGALPSVVIEGWEAMFVSVPLGIAVFVVKV